ncbi:MAG: hypothetical protein MUF58_18675 [Arcicella sp.]|jgi:hypothetical protein|nr:hypothetical protein [Arcicella sp.]
MAKHKSIELLEPILIETFGLERVFQPTSLLTEWLSADGEINAMDAWLLEESCAKLLENADSWNEEELKMQFISFMIFLARYDKPIRTYYDREISAEINGIHVSSKVDMMLSKGIGELIKTPYFFLHEYKREKKYSGDPVGQMLGGMLIGQAKNNDEKPIYGCYVQGRNWYFSLLDGKKYVVSKGFDSSEMDEAKQIIYILRKLKVMIDERIRES